MMGSSIAVPLVLDLGCGNGRFSLLSSLARPKLPHVALEMESMHLRYLRRRARQRGVTNLHLFLGDAADLLRRLAPGSAAEIHIYHPQPWHEAGHCHRRLFQPRFQLDAHRALIAGGSLCTQTDSEPYALYLRRTLPALFDVRELSDADDWPDGLGKPRGRRELVAAAKGLQVWRFACIRRQLSDEEAVQRAARLPAPQFKSNRHATFHRKKRLRRGEGNRG
jgi:tRNA (guanine-N7-)-methyltransferase